MNAPIDEYSPEYHTLVSLFEILIHHHQDKSGFLMEEWIRSTSGQALLKSMAQQPDRLLYFHPGPSGKPIAWSALAYASYMTVYNQGNTKTLELLGQQKAFWKGSHQEGLGCPSGTSGIGWAVLAALSNKNLQQGESSFWRCIFSCFEQSDSLRNTVNVLNLSWITTETLMKTAFSEREKEAANRLMTAWLYELAGNWGSFFPMDIALRFAAAPWGLRTLRHSCLEVVKDLCKRKPNLESAMLLYQLPDSHQTPLERSRL